VTPKSTKGRGRGRFSVTFGIGPEGPGPWIAEAFLTTQDSGPVIGELIIRPGQSGNVPPGGLTKKLLNDLPIGAFQAVLRTIEANYARNPQSLPDEWRPGYGEWRQLYEKDTK